MSLCLPDKLRHLRDRPAAVLGAGVSGRGAAALLRELGFEVRVYAEQAQEGGEIRARFGEQEASLHSLVVFSPGFPVEHHWLQVARAQVEHCLGELDFASLFWKGRVLGITGTNGKTTLTEFLCFALRQAGQNAEVTGNIGRSFCELVRATQGGRPDTWAICEVSSFQAETLQHFRADGALWTNFAEDHLERHPDLMAYFEAKLRLISHSPQERCFVGSTVSRAAMILNHSLPLRAAVSTENAQADPRLRGSVFAEMPQLENFLLAAAWWRRENLPEAALYGAAQAFKLAKHRLGLVAELEGIQWWNDSKATNFHAVEAALKRFENPVVLIAGGKAKGGDLEAFVARIAGKVRFCLFIGTTAPALAAACARLGLAHEGCGTLEQAVRRAAHLAQRGEAVLFSPGFASFDQFNGYAHRGDVFEQEVYRLNGQPALS